MSKKWSTQEIIIFLKAYEENSWLWDVNSELYKNREAREIAYENMAKVMQMDGFGIQEVKAKIRSIRNAYTLELAKIEKSKKLGTDANVYKPRVPWFTIADKILHNVVHITEPQTISENIKQENTTIIESTKLLRPRKQKRKPVQLEDNTKRKAEETVDNNVKTKSQLFPKNISQELPKTSTVLPTAQEDEFECFGKCVASQLRKLSESTALKSMAFIHSYLVKQRLKSFSQDISQKKKNTDDSDYSDSDKLFL